MPRGLLPKLPSLSKLNSPHNSTTGMIFFLFLLPDISSAALALPYSGHMIPLLLHSSLASCLVSAPGEARLPPFSPLLPLLVFAWFALDLDICLGCLSPRTTHPRSRSWFHRFVVASVLMLERGSQEPGSSPPHLVCYFENLCAVFPVFF